MTKKITILAITCLIFLPASVIAQNANPCRTDQVMEQHYLEHPEMKMSAEEFNQFSRNYSKGLESTKAGQEYVFPVVFHVFGTVFNDGTTITDEIVIDAIRRTNEDFAGQTADWNDTDPDFNTVKSVINVRFELAKIDPNGNPTTGIIYHDNESGFGNTNKRAISQIQSYAWDNYKYMNVYIMRDLYANRDYYNSGVAWYPDEYMSDNNLARVVYNGSYLGDNTDENFRSVLTHEFGHWLNLAHTFQGGCPDGGSCSNSGDYCCDTPPVDNSSNQRTNCLGQKTNWQNFMDYSDMYAMYTSDQNDRVMAAMQHTARFPLWQEANLIETGVQTGGGSAPVANFTADNTNILEGETVNFTDQSTNNPTSWSWSFPGGSPSSSTQQNPIITYSAEGIYDVILTVNNSNGTDVLNKQNYMTVTAGSTGNNILMQNGTFSTCSATFSDAGGSSSYSDNENYVLTIQPEVLGQVLVVDFTSFTLDAKGRNCGEDYLEIYDGTSTSASLIGSYCGTNSPGTVFATNPSGVLTFRFISDSRKTANGWTANITCTASAASGVYFNSEVKVFPNPASDLINILAPDNSEVKIYNSTGSIIKELTTNGKTELNLSEFPKGIYIMRINNQTKRFVKK